MAHSINLNTAIPIPRNTYIAMPSKKTFQCSQLERHREALASENQTCQLIIPRHGSNHSQFRRLEYLHQNDDLQTHHQTLASKNAVQKINKPTLQNINIIKLKTLQTMFNRDKYMLRYKIRNWRYSYWSAGYAFIPFDSNHADWHNHHCHQHNGSIYRHSISSSYRKKHLYQLKGQN